MLFPKTKYRRENDKNATKVNDATQDRIKTFTQQMCGKGIIATNSRSGSFPQICGKGGNGGLLGATTHSNHGNNSLNFV